MWAFLGFEWSVNILSQWFIDNLFLSFQLSNMFFLATVNAMKIKVWRCCEIVSEQRSPERAMEGERGMLRLRILDSFPMTSDQNCPTGLQMYPYGTFCKWWCVLCVGPIQYLLYWVGYIFELYDIENVLLHIVCQLMSDVHLPIGIETVLSLWETKSVIVIFWAKMYSFISNGGVKSWKLWISIFFNRSLSTVCTGRDSGLVSCMFVWEGQTSW